MFRKLINKIRHFRSWKRIVWDEGHDVDIPLYSKIKYALKGFSAEECLFYDFAHNDCREYISDYERLNSREINGPFKFILDDKLVFEEVFGKYTRVPKNYAWIKNGIVYGLHDNGLNNDNLIYYLKKYKKTVLKWNEKGGGAGTYVISCIDNKLYVNDNEQTPEYVQSLFDREGNAILCEYITQSDFSASLYPYTTNTIRIVCAKKKGERDARFIIASQRVGSKESIPVDNASCGGLIIPIDGKTGKLGAGMVKRSKENRIRIPFDHHPDTNEEFTGKEIPNWKSIVDEVVALTNKVPYLNFVAWDILLTEDGFCVIEGNASSGNALFQMNKGVRNSELGDIYRSYGIIK